MCLWGAYSHVYKWHTSPYAELNKQAEIICFSNLSPVLLSSNVTQTVGKNSNAKVNMSKFIQGLFKAIDILS